MEALQYQPCDDIRRHGAHRWRPDMHQDRMCPGNPAPCCWYFKCDNAATGTLAHPILGDVPICGRCRERDQHIRTGDRHAEQ